MLLRSSEIKPLFSSRDLISFFKRKFLFSFSFKFILEVVYH